MTKIELLDEFFDTLNDYFDCGYREGRDHRSHDDKDHSAIRLLSKLHSLFNQALDYQSDTQSISN